jgi:hypothetical protein
MELVLSFKDAVVLRPEYTISLERFEDQIWVHAEIRKWSASIKKRLRQDWDYVFGLYGGPMYALNYPHGCKKHQKFMISMGFEFFESIEVGSGERYVYWRSS